MLKIDLNRFPALCLPDNIDETDLIDITNVGDSFITYLNPYTHKVYDGAKYYHEYLNK